MEKNESGFTPNTKKLVSGFTLLELIIVVIIITTFVGLSIANYNQFNEEKKLEEQAKQLIDVLDLASKKASSGESPSCTSFQGYRLNIQSSGQSYVLEICCSENWSCTELSESQRKVQDYSLSTTSLTISPVNTRLVFKKLTSGVVINENINTQSVTLRVKNTNLNPNKCIPITIERSGLINEGAKTQTCP